MKFIKTIIIILVLITIKANAQNDCVDAIIVCGNTGFEGLSATGIGAQELFNSNTCSSEENNSIWMKIYIKDSGTLGFTLVPESSNINEDFDFFVFGPNATCTNLGQAIRCSTTNPQASVQPNNYTGMNEVETDTSEGPGALGNSFVKWLEVNAGESYYIVIDRPIGISNFSLQWTGTATFNPPPTFNMPSAASINLEECDNDGLIDLSTNFNLEQNTAMMIGNQSNVSVTYHLSQNDALTNKDRITNTTSFTNTTNPQTIYTRITNNVNQCYNVTDFTISTKETVQLSNIVSYACDDTTDGNDSNGQTTFYLDKVSSDIFENQDISSLIIKYYISESDANKSVNEIQNSFYNSIPQQQNLFIKATNIEGCTTINEIKLNVVQPPTKVDITLVQCSTGASASDFSLFNLNEATTSLINNNPDLTTTFFTSYFDAQNNLNELDAAYTNIANPQNIYARILSKSTGCYSISNINLVVNVITEKNYVINPVCDDDGIEDGLHTFNLADTKIPITPSQTLSYYPTLTDALLEENKIINPDRYFNEIPYHQDVYARIEQGNDCFGISKIKLEVLKLPDIITIDNKKVCRNSPNYYVQLDAGIQDNSSPSSYTYIWFKDNNVIKEETNYTLNVNRPGNYAVQVTNLMGCSKKRNIEVTSSDIATIENISIVDLSEINSVTINVSGSGDYKYSMDSQYGPFQESNFFDNVPAGIHEIYINDDNNCGLISKTIALLGVPKFFTPNNDGFNDYWNIKGVSETMNSKSLIYIFDRYGKLIKQIKPLEAGWDGTSRGTLLPADDYWFTIKLEDKREVRGHFSLKR